MIASEYSATFAEAERLHGAGDAAGAEAACRAVLAAEPGHAGAGHLLALIAHGRGDPAALDLMRAACAQGSATALHHLNLAQLCRREGLAEEAETAALRAAALDPDLAPAWFVLGCLAAERGVLDAALEGFERAILADPDFLAARANAAAVLVSLEAWERAEAAYAALLARAPGNAAWRAAHASCLKESGDFTGAVAGAEAALAADPDLIEASLTAAAVELAFRRPRRALDRLDRALARRPDEPALVLARAAALRRLERFDEALEGIDAALALRPDEAALHEGRAMVLQAAGEDRAAEAAYDRAEAFAADPATVLANRAVLLMETNRIEAARATFDRVVAARPRLAAAWYNRAQVVRFRPGDPAIEAMAALREVGSFEDRLGLEFALGKAHWDLGDAEAAFAHWRAGNRMKRSIVDWDPVTEAASLEPPEDLTPFADAPSSEVPVFVVGMPRSGTSLVEQVLASHAAIFGAGELAALDLLAEEPAPGPAYLAGLRRRAPDASRIVDKMPTNFRHIGTIRRALPNARIIHCVRDPLDTCFSCWIKLFDGPMDFTYDLGELGRHYRAYAALMAYWRRVLPADRFMEVRYEAMVGDLEAEARRLVAFLGLPWDPACLRFHETDRAVRTASFAQVRRPVYRSSIGASRAVRAHLGPLIDALGDLA